MNQKFETQRTRQSGYDKGLRWSFQASAWEQTRLRDILREKNGEEISAYYFHEAVIECPVFTDQENPDFLDYMFNVEHRYPDDHFSTKAQTFWAVESERELEALPIAYIRGFLEGATEGVRIDYGEDFLSRDDWDHLLD